MVDQKGLDSFLSVGRVHLALLHEIIAVTNLNLKSQTENGLKSFEDNLMFYCILFLEFVVFLLNIYVI